MNQKHNPVVTIKSLSHDGRGIAHLEGKTIFVEGALVGEELQIEYLKRRSRWDEAKIVNILRASSTRQQPECDFFSICGGCSLQHIDSATQIIEKQAVLLEHLQHIGGVAPKVVLPATTGASYGYRRKARLGVRYVIKKEKLLIGFREKNGRYLADIESCSVLDPSIGKKIPILRQFLLALDNYLNIPQIEIAVGDNHTAIILRHLTPLPPKDLETIAAFALSENYHIYLQPGGPETAKLFYPTDSAERLNYHLQDYDIEMLFHPTDFTQVNSEINKKLIKMAIELLEPTASDVILDLFCGIGNFTLPLSRFCKKVIGVEGGQLMVARGYENAAHNNITNVEFYCQDLSSNNADWSANIDMILLDPPRVGALEVIQKIPTTTAKNVVYVSCNPSTLARDAGHLCKNGFELTAAGVLDMFPHTSHVESIALFKRLGRNKNA